MQKIILIVICATAITLSACTVHKLDIQQGNVMTPEMREQLKLGMSKRQVSFVLGSPLLIDPFHRDRWDYVYTFAKGRKTPEIQRMTLFFEGDKLVRMEDDTLPSGTVLPPPPPPASPKESAPSSP